MTPKLRTPAAVRVPSASRSGASLGSFDSLSAPSKPSRYLLPRRLALIITTTAAIARAAFTMLLTL